MCKSFVCVCISWHITYCNGWLNGLKLEEDPSSLFWTHSPYLILAHPQKQFASQHPEAVHSAATWSGTKQIQHALQVLFTSWSSNILCVYHHSHSGETFVLQPGFDLCRSGVHVQTKWSPTVSLWGRVKGKKCHMLNLLNANTAELCVTLLTGASSMGPLLLTGSRTFRGTLPSWSRVLRTSHHCLDFWITCGMAKEPNTSNSWM